MIDGHLQKVAGGDRRGGASSSPAGRAGQGARRGALLWPAAGERVDSRPPGGCVRDPIRHRKATRAARAANALVDAAIYFERLCLVARGKGVRVEAPGAID